MPRVLKCTWHAAGSPYPEAMVGGTVGGWVGGLVDWWVVSSKKKTWKDIEVNQFYGSKDV